MTETGGAIIDEIMAEIARINGILREAFSKAHLVAAQSSPVDTGRLRSSWQYRLGGSVDPTPDRGKPAGHIHGHDIYPDIRARSRRISKANAMIFDVSKHRLSVLGSPVRYAVYVGTKDAKHHMAAKAEAIIKEAGRFAGMAIR